MSPREHDLLGTDSAYSSIGNVSQVTGLSLRSIRYYEQVGLVVPSAHTKGGHRLYTEGDIDRLRLIMKMKPLEFSLAEMRTLLETRDDLRLPDTAEPDRARALERLRMYGELVESRWQHLREQLRVAEDFRDQIQDELVAQRSGRDSGT